MRRRLLVVAATLVVAGSLSAAFLARKPAGPALLTALAATEAPPPASGIDGLAAVEPLTAAPDIAFEDVDGQTHRLGEFAGRPVLLTLWATWCVPCVAELPSLAVLRPRAEAAGWVVLPLSLDRGGTARVRAFFASHGISGLPVWNDPKNDVAGAFAIRGVPTTLVIDRQGRTAARLEGAADWSGDDVLARLQALAP